jgi:hypothetical protein
MIVLLFLGGLAILAWSMKTGISPTGPLTKFAMAIKKAEGDKTRNNPGNLKGKNGILRVFPDYVSGWNALLQQLSWIMLGKSAYLHPSMTFRDFAFKWTGNDNAMAWTNIVTKELGVSPDMRVGDYLDQRKA